MLRELFNFICRYRYLKPLIIKLFASNIGEENLVNLLKRESQIIVSLSAKEEDFYNIELCLVSIFKQTISPNKVILWISKDYELAELPYSITKFIKNGLEIRFIEDKGSFNNIIYALKDFGNCIVVTAENNVYYPKDWLKKLYHSYITNPKDIHLNQAIIINDSLSFNTHEYVKTENASFEYFPIVTGGVLYPPNCFVNEVFREDIYKKNVNTTWEVWSWFMAIISNRKFRLIKSHMKFITCVNIFTQIKHEIFNLKNRKNKEAEMRKLASLYGQNIFNKLN